MTDFTAHGFHCISNACGFEIEFSDDGERARTRDIGTDAAEVSEWLTIEWVPNEDFEGDENDENEGAYHPVIDPNGLNIPLNLVMRAN